MMGERTSICHCRCSLCSRLLTVPLPVFLSAAATAPFRGRFTASLVNSAPSAPLFPLVSLQMKLSGALPMLACALLLLSSLLPAVLAETCSDCCYYNDRSCPGCNCNNRDGNPAALAGWAIALIVIFCILFICCIVFCILRLLSCGPFSGRPMAYGRPWGGGTTVVNQQPPTQGGAVVV